MTFSTVGKDDGALRAHKEPSGVTDGMCTECGWRDFATAPKDGTKIDVCTRFGERITDVRWREGAWRHFGLNGFDRMDLVKIDVVPTHWMPRPSAPLSTDPSADFVGSLSTSSLPQITSIDARVKELETALAELLRCGNAIVGANIDDPNSADAFDMYQEARMQARSALSQGSPEQ